MRTSEEITRAMKKVRDTPITNVESVLADYIRELHDRLTEARREYHDIADLVDGPIPTQERIILDRIDETLAKLPEEYR